MEDATRRMEFVAGLRELADFIEARPGAPVPYDLYAATHVDGREDVREAVRLLGMAEKDYSGDFFTALRSFPGAIRYGIQAYRATVCERVVVGTETVHEPDPAILASVPRVPVEREVVEWRCEPVLAGGEGA